MYVFNNLLLVVRLLDNNSDDKEIIRITLDDSSYCIKKDNTV